MSRNNLKAARTALMLKGVGLGFAAFALFSISDAFVKQLHGQIAPFQLSFYGSLFAVVLLPMVWRRGDTAVDLVAARKPWLWVLRGILTVGGSVSSILAFTHLTMAEAFALIFLMPLIITLFSVLFLKEPVSLKGWLAVSAGFIGVLVILRPGFREISIGHVAALMCGICGAGVSVLLRVQRSSEKAITLFGAGVIPSLLICGGLMLANGYVQPTWLQWAEIAGYAMLSALANLIMIFASRRAPASVLAPTQYSQMLWGVALGYIFFHDRIDAITYLGIALIVGAGLWLFMPRLGGAARVKT
jgi:S-adenosylmethionine uptake transporter